MLNPVIQSIDASSDVITFTAAHGFTTGMIVGVEARVDAVFPGGLNRFGAYAVRAASSTTITLHPTAADAAAGTSKIDITSAGDAAAGKLKVARLTVRARVERIIAKRVAAITGIGRVELWESRGHRLDHLDAVICSNDEDFELIDSGNLGTTRSRLPITILLALRPDDREQLGATTLQALWLGELVAAVTAQAEGANGTYLIESTGAQLADGFGIDGSARPPVVPGQPAFSTQLGIWVEYAHPMNNLYTLRG